MGGWVLFFGIVGIIFSALGIVLRVVDYRRKQDVAALVLSVALFAVSWYAFIYLMILTGSVVHVPNFYNKGIPLYYLIAPCMFFYVKLRLRQIHKLPRYWYLHLAPFVFGLVDIMPYALTSSAEKQALMVRLVTNIRTGFEHEYGFINQQWHYIIRLLLAFAYLLAQWRALFMADTEDGVISRRLLFSLYTLTIIYSLFIAIQVGMVMNILFNQLQASYILRDADQLIWIGGLYLLFSLWVCFGPRLWRSD
ncbi:hypothetical protein [Parapedobacter soli]|uniref:hypothetical protein n=1 Tax=Parapedobacter soli TaxID=416955 RepID=UPI0021C6A0D2|nr:hypothetical protein [Parapedobacter soli]